MSSFGYDAVNARRALSSGKLERGIKKAVGVHLPGRVVLSMNDRGVWLSQIVEVTLDGNDVIVFKIALGAGDPGTLFRGGSCSRVLREHGLPAPRILAADASREIFGYPFIIEEWVDGTRMGVLLDHVSKAEAREIYESVGRLYREMHSIHGERPGIWIDNPQETLGSPVDYMYRAEILEGSGKRAVEQGRISHSTYYRVVALWALNMGYLNDFLPSLVHASAFPWTICLEKGGNGWRVVKLTALDVCWWDPAVDIASLRYPPFGEVSTDMWDAFQCGYGPLPERKRILLYAVMQRLMAIMGAFREPQSARNESWVETYLKDLDPFMDEIEGTD